MNSRTTALFIHVLNPEKSHHSLLLLWGGGGLLVVPTEIQGREVRRHPQVEAAQSELCGLSP